MSEVFIGSDWHLGHKNLHQYRTHINSIDENYQFLGDNWKLKKRDTAIFLGDMCFEPRAFAFLQSLPAAKKILVMGNHDWERFNVNKADILDTFDDIHGIRAYKNTWLTHCPMHASELRKKTHNVHGHIHIEETNPQVRDDARYVNVNVDVMYPKTGEIILNWQHLMELVEKGEY